MKLSRTESVLIRDIQYNVRHWGSPDSPLVFFLHGWMDASATFQFLVDALPQDWHVVAPDWRGYGASQWLQRLYWFPDYYLDLDALINHYSPGKPVRLVGHSMGGSIASIYSAVKPEKVAQLAVLDFLGIKPDPGVEAPDQIERWMKGASGTPRMNSYADYSELAQRLMFSNHRLSPERADFLARNVGQTRSAGRVAMACDPWHKVPSPFVYRVEDQMACWRRVQAPTLLLMADQGHVAANLSLNSEEYLRRTGCFRAERICVVEDCGHNMQHDQPERVAALLEEFLSKD